MKSYESSAKTVEEAISQGLDHLGVAINDVTIDIISEGSKGLFGLFGSKQAKVRLTLKAVEAEDASSLINAAHEKAMQDYKMSSQERPKAKSSPEKRENYQPQAAPSLPREAKPVVVLDEATQQVLINKSIAFLEELTTLMSVNTKITGHMDENNHIYLEMVGEDMGLLIGRRGETLDALQYLTNLHTNQGQENYIRISLDTEDYRAKREESLVRLANRMANRAVKTGRRVSLEPMNPYERRIIHNTLQSNASVNTHSEGDDPYRRLVITVKKK